MCLIFINTLTILKLIIPHYPSISIVTLIYFSLPNPNSRFLVWSFEKEIFFFCPRQGDWLLIRSIVLYMFSTRKGMKTIFFSNSNWKSRFISAFVVLMRMPSPSFFTCFQLLLHPCHTNFNPWVLIPIPKDKILNIPSSRKNNIIVVVKERLVKWNATPWRK